MQNRKITIKDIANKANVSIGTVDRVIHNRGEVKEETRQLILSIVDELGYTPNLLAKTLSLKKTIKIAALIPEPGKQNQYWEEPISGFKKAASELLDYYVSLVIFPFDTIDEKSFIKKYSEIIEMKPDGVILSPVFHKPSVEFCNLCNENNIPYVFIDSMLEDIEPLAYFGQDSVQSGYLSAKLIKYSLLEGSKILIVNLANKKAINRHLKLREEGFMNYIRSSGNSINIKSLEIDLSGKGEPAKTLHSVFDSTPGINAIFVTNSRVSKVAEFIEKEKLNEILLVGYDLVDENINYLQKGIIDFLICQKPEDQGYRCMMTLFNHIYSKKKVVQVNFSPIDIVMKENLSYYKHSEDIHSKSKSK